MDADALLDGLTPGQRQAVTSDGAPLCILAGAGSGKTRVLTRRVAHRVVTGAADPGHALVLTFTRQAAAELRRRLAGLGVREGVAAGTFHAVAWAQLRRRWLDRGEHAPALLDRRARFVARLLEGGPNGAGRRGPAAVASRDVVAEIEWAKARVVAPTDYETAAAAAGRRPAVAPATVAALFARYEDEKRRRRVIDFDDLLLLCVRAMEHDEDFAAAQRWRFRHLFVDEFQDVNPLQFRLLEAWRGDGSDLCVVGDPNQAIYGWNGADPALLGDFERRFPHATVVRLTDNFRSTPQIISAAGAVLGPPAGCPPLRPHRPDGAAPVVRAWATEVEEAGGVARGVRDRRRPGQPWGDTAVLARTRAQLALVAEALEAAGVPHRIRGASPLLDRPDVRLALDDLRRIPAGTPLAAVIADLDVDDLADLAREHRSVDATATVDGFLAWLAATAPEAGDDGAGDAVVLATFHAAKGLEWPVVFVVGLEDGLVPIARARGLALDEERRLLYVALTRARDELHCSWARRRTLGSRTSERAPSPWLAAVEGAAPPRAAVTPGGAARRVADERRRLRTSRPPAPTQRLVATLREWRRATAGRAGVPPPVVLPDRAVDAVARARPRSRDELLGVPGIGPVKAARYGGELLALVAADGDGPSDP